MLGTEFSLANVAQNIILIGTTISVTVAATLSIIKLFKKIEKIRNIKLAATRGTIVPDETHKEKLLDHSLFKSLLRLRSVVVSSLDCGHPVKTEVFRDIMIHKIDTWANLLIKQATVIDCRCKKDCRGLCSMSALSLVRYNRDLLQEGLSEYSTYFETDPSYSDNEKEILRYSVKLFNSFHASAVGAVQGTIDSVITNSKYGYCAKWYQADIFSAFEIGMKMMLNQTNKALVSCNGYFKDKEFRLRSHPLPNWKEKLK
jgi:hypothetical protein